MTNIGNDSNLSLTTSYVSDIFEEGFNEAGRKCFGFHKCNYKQKKPSKKTSKKYRYNCVS